MNPPRYQLGQPTTGVAKCFAKGGAPYLARSPIVRGPNLGNTLRWDDQCHVRLSSAIGRSDDLVVLSLATEFAVVAHLHEQGWRRGSLER